MTRLSNLPIERIVLPRVIEHEYEIGELTAMGAKSREKLLGFDVADPSIDTPAHIKEALVKALDRKGVTHYTRIRGLPAFVESVASFYSRLSPRFRHASPGRPPSRNILWKRPRYS